MKHLFIFLFLCSNAFASEMPWTKIQELLDAGLKSELYPTASVYVGNESQTLFQYTVGDSGKLYDVASLTKVVATNTSIMILDEKGELSISDKVSKYFPDFTEGAKANVTLEDLLRHRSGLPSGARPLQGENFDSYVLRITSHPLNYEPRTKTVYSDLSFILLGRVVEIVSGKKLSVFSKQNIFDPLKMGNSSFLINEADTQKCAPTSQRKDCKVHDPTANMLLPESLGNAGVFSTIEDLARFSRMVLNKGELDGVRIFSEKTFYKMTTTDGPRGLGWDFTSEYSTKPRGEVFPAGISFGHTGYTGTTIWIDPKSKVFYVFLSNRVFMGDEATKKPFSEFRNRLSTAIGNEVISF